MESSFCGCDQGVLSGLHFDTEHLKAIGTDFCQALSMMKDGGDDWAVEKCVEICSNRSVYLFAKRISLIKYKFMIKINSLIKEEE